MNAQEIQSHLDRYNGCEQPYFRHTGFCRIDYTDGIKFLQDKVGCLWLTNAIASYQTSKFKAINERQFWKLTVNLESHAGILTCDDGDGNILVNRSIPYTDFPLSEIRIWVCIQPEVFMFLPSEY